MQMNTNDRLGVRVRDLLSLTLGVGLVCGALRSPTPVWSLAVSEITLAFLLVSPLATLYRTGHARVYWMGFTVLAWGRLTVGERPWFTEL